MIEINLLPGSRKSKRSAGPSLNVGAMVAGVLAQVKDPFLIIAVGGLAVGLGVTALQYVVIGGKESAITERHATAVQDSTRYASVLAERRAAVTQRDSVVRQFSIIRAIDGERYTWPHVLDELSDALPPYTWLLRVQQTSQVISVVRQDSATGTRAKRIEEVANAAVSSVTKLQLRIVGQTVDLQALTRYIQLLEASPFIENVQFIGSVPKPSDGPDVREFTLDMQFQVPDPSAIRTVPLNVAVR